MKDWKLEKGISSSKEEEETRNCKVTVRISDAVQGLPKKEEGNYEPQAGVYGAMYAAATARGYSEWIQSTNVDKMVTDK